MKLRRVHVLFAALGLAACLVPLHGRLRSLAIGAIQVAKGKKTVEERLAEYGTEARRRLGKDFQRLGLPYPPERVCLVGLKQERILEVWVIGSDGEPKHLKSYPILAASGRLGPKLAEGDRQVPEGLYKIESLNPNSLYHLSLRIDYPNEYDEAKGREDGRSELGSDIMIHGSSVSVGCLAMGDPASEDLFVLAADVGLEGVSVILSPVDFRKRSLPPDLPGLPSWAPELHGRIESELRKLKTQAAIVAPGAR